MFVHQESRGDVSQRLSSREDWEVQGIESVKGGAQTLSRRKERTQRAERR